MLRWTLPLLLVVSLAPLQAQTRIAVGVAAGMQTFAYENARVVTGAEALVQRGPWAVHAAFDYADFSRGGALIAVHPNLAYIATFARDYTLLVGAGPTFVNIEELDDSRTFNVEVELARRFKRTDVFARARYYDYDAGGFRTQVSPTGPVFSLGARFTLR